jgi:hypothetical protein
MLLISINAPMDMLVNIAAKRTGKNKDNLSRHGIAAARGYNI